MVLAKWGRDTCVLKMAIADIDTLSDMLWRAESWCVYISTSVCISVCVGMTLCMCMCAGG